MSTVHSVRAGHYTWNRNWSRRGFLPKLSMTLFISSVFWLFTLLRWTLSMQRPDRRVSLIVDLNQFFTLRSVLKYLSTVHDVVGRVSALRIALRIAGNIVVCFTSSIIPRELSSSGLCFCTSYHARASSTRLSMLFISLMKRCAWIHLFLFAAFLSDVVRKYGELLSPKRLSRDWIKESMYGT